MSLFFIQFRFEKLIICLVEINKTAMPEEVINKHVY